MKKIKDFLKGKKTYLVVAAAIITAVVSYSEDVITLAQLVATIFAAVGVATVRDGITTGAVKRK